MNTDPPSQPSLLGALFEEPPPVAGGLELGGYELLEEIASGGMGVVWRAWHPALDRIVALKTIRSAHLARPEDVARFKAEATSAARLRHPHIVTVHDIGEEEGQHYFTMELVDGPSLAGVLRNGPLAPARAATLLREIARAVQHAHDQGILHRDLKPSNILLRPDGSPCVSDFGLAKALTHDSAQTLSGTVLGSPAYMPPEQALGRISQLGARSDVYSLGAILYECLTGQPPFAGATPVETLRRVVEQEPVPPHVSRPAISRDLETICLTCLAKDPARRYASAAALAEDLERFLGHEPIRARPVGPGGRLLRWSRRKPGLAAALVAVVLTGLAGFLGVVHQWRNAVASRSRAQQNEARALSMEQDARRAEYDTALLLANDALHSGRLSLVKELLQRTTPSPGQPDLRGWEWRYLDSRVQSQETRTLWLAGTPVAAVAAAPDGSAVAAASDGLKLTTWSPGNGVRLGERSLPGKVRALIYSPDSRWLAVSTKDWHILVCDAATLESVLTISPGEDPTDVRFTDDSRELQIAGNRKVWRWSVDERRQVGETPMRPSVASVQHPATGRAAYSPLELNSLVFRKSDGSLTEPWLWPVGTYLTGLFFAPAGDRCVSLFNDGSIRVWDLATGQIRSILRGHQEAPYVCAFHPRRPLLATGGGDESIFLWNLETGEFSRHFHGHGDVVRSLAFSPDGRRLYSGSRDGTLREWDAEASAETGNGFVATPGYVKSTWSAEGTSLLEAFPDGRLLYRRMAAPQCRFEWTEPEATGMDLSPDGLHLLMVGPRGWELRRLENGRFVTERAHDAPSGRLLTTQFDLDGRFMASLNREGEVTVWRLADLTPLHRFNIPAEFVADLCEFSFVRGPDHLFLAGKKSGCQVWDVAAGKVVVRLPGRENAIHRAAVSPDFTTFALTSIGQPVEIWKLGEGGAAVRQATLSRSVFEGECVAFSADGRRLAVGSANGAVTLINSRSLMPLAQLKEASFQLGRIGFSPGDDAIVAFSRPWLFRWSCRPAERVTPSP